MTGEPTETDPEPVPTAFEQLVRSTDSSVEQTELRRAIHEAVATTPGEVESHWSRWFLDAGRAVGLRIDEFTASAEAAFDQADSGVTRLGGRGWSRFGRSPGGSRNAPTPATRPQNSV